MKNYLIVIALLLFFQFNFAQESNSLEYIKAVNYVTCICVNDALPDNEKIDCESQSINKLKITDSRTIDLFDELQNLKNKSIVGDYSKLLTEDIFNDQEKLIKIYSFATSSKRKGAKMDKIKGDIKEYISRNKPSVKAENITNESTELQSSDTDSIVNNGEAEAHIAGNKQPNSNYNTTEATKFNVWTTITLGLLFLIATFLLLIYFKFNKKIDNLNKRIDRRIKKDESPNLASPHIIQSSNESSKIGKLEKDVKNIQDWIANHNSTAITMEEKSPELILTLPKPKVTQSVVFYMATPNKEDSSFDISSQTETFKPTQSLYKFTIDNSNSSKAKFEFFSDEAGIRDSIDSPQTYLDPVCEPQNARNPNAKKIVTTSPGTAEKRNYKWVKITNAKIKYE